MEHLLEAAEQHCERRQIGMKVVFGLDRGNCRRNISGENSDRCQAEE